MIKNKSGVYENIIDSFKKSNLRVNEYSGLYLAKIKDNEDVLKIGRVRVHLSGSNRNEKDEDSWITCIWCSPFAGSTKEYDLGNTKTFTDTQKSYGWWSIPPDIDNYVIVAFPEGLTTGVVLACLNQMEVNHSIPGLAYNEVVSNKPLTEKNRKAHNPEEQTNIVHEPFLFHLQQEGLQDDKTRGITSSSARRESPSHVYGFLSPKQHQFIIDDGKPTGNDYQTPNPDSQIRIRTQNGMQVLMHSEKNVIYINNAD